MAIQEQSKIDHIELNGDGTVLVRRKDYTVVGSVEVFIGHHTRLITPDDDISGEATEENWWLTSEVKTVCLEYWTKRCVKDGSKVEIELEKFSSN